MSKQKDILLKINGLEINISQTDGKIILEIDPETKQVQQRKQGNQRKRKAETPQDERNKVQKISGADVKTQTTERVTFSQPIKFPQLQLPPFAKQMFSQEMKTSSPEFSSYLKEQAMKPTPSMSLENISKKTSEEVLKES